MATPPQPPNPYGPPPGGNPYAQPVPAADNPYAQPAQPAAPQYGYPQQPPAYGYPQQPPTAPPPPPGPGAPPYGYPGAAPYAAAPAAGPGGELTCRFCGGYPAANTTFRQHRGVILLMFFIRRPGPFCRTCGTATFRELQAKTIVQGWWSWSSWLINWIVIISNVVKLNKINALPEPMPGPGQPMIPGPPVTRRPVMFVFAVPVLAFVLVLTVLLTGSGTTTTTASPVDTGTSAPADPGTGAAGAPSASPTSDAGAGGSTAGSGATAGSGTTSSQYQAGQCLIENGTGDNTTVTQAGCTASGAQRILKVLPGTTDDTGCSNVSGYHDSLTDFDNSVVYCMGAKLQ